MRKTVPVQLIDDGQALDFEITQMSATQKERWLLRALFTLANGAAEADVDVDEARGLDDFMRELARKKLNIFKGISLEKVQPLLDDLLTCCALVRDKARLQCTPETVDGYISDVKTLFRLRVESFKVNFPDFFTASDATEGKSESPSREESPRRATLKIPRG